MNDTLKVERAMTDASRAAYAGTRVVTASERVDWMYRYSLANAAVRKLTVLRKRATKTRRVER